MVSKKKRTESKVSDEVTTEKVTNGVTVEEVAKELKYDEIDDLEFIHESEVTGNVIYVSPFKWHNGEKIPNQPYKYITIAQRMLMDKGSVIFKGRGLAGPGFAIICAKVLRTNLHNLKIVTVWTENAPEITVDKITDQQDRTRLVTGLKVTVSLKEVTKPKK